jgi:glycosyltransferase involved in cell wall biosynthesis
MVRTGLVSVVVPTHYRNERLRRAVDSCLAQTYDDVEVVVVDDSGEAHARPVAAEYGDAVDYVAHERNRGGNPARNTGIEAAAGEYVQLLDDDDVLLPDKLRSQVRLIESSEGVGVAYGGVRYEGGEYRRPTASETENPLHTALGLRWPTCPTSSMLVAAPVLASVHPLADRAAADDVGLRIELARRTDFDFVDEPVVRKGASPTHRSDKPAASDEVFSILDEYADLYDDAPPRVRREALTWAYGSRGYRLATTRRWSPTAVYSYAQALRHSPRLDPKLVGGLVGAALGAPGMWLAVRLSTVVEGS